MKKGFTLIELLAVIVILAIIALIAIPTITNIVEEARKGAAKNSILGYIDAIEKQAAINLLNSDETDDIKAKTYDVSELTEKKVVVKGKVPTGTVTVNAKGEVTDYELVINNYTVTPTNGDSNKPSAEKSSGNSTPAPTGPKLVAAQQGETYKGIVYLDPTDLSKTCTATDAANNVNSNGTPTEIKTGCMKWYIFSETNDAYNMILDHNTTAKVQWNTTGTNGTNVAYASSLVKPYVDALVTTSKWKVNPRLITVAEVNAITGKTSFDAASTSSWYYLDRASTGANFQTKYANAATKSSYAWLYDYLYDAVTYGANYNDNNTYALANNTATTGGTYAYWTSDTVGTAGSGSYVWRVDRDGHLGFSNASSTNYGVRPVITIQKSVLE